LEQRNKENRQKTKFQTSTCAKQETPTKICKTYAKPKIPKKKKKKQNHKPSWPTAGFSSYFLKNTAAAQHWASS
jgi:hypothetical protein